MVYISNSMWLVYERSDGEYEFQPWQDLTDAGTILSILLSAETGYIRTLMER